jgi:hypothetical protein
LVASPTFALPKTSPQAPLRNCKGQTKYIAMDAKGPDTGRTGSGMLQLNWFKLQNGVILRSE